MCRRVPNTHSLRRDDGRQRGHGVQQAQRQVCARRADGVIHRLRDAVVLRALCIAFLLQRRKHCCYSREAVCVPSTVGIQACTATITQLITTQSQAMCDTSADPASLLRDG